ncbi:MAG: aminodeoxychorismate lyase [Burkholderiales bacterium]
MPLINGVFSDALPIHDRGFAYGDGVFRTLRLRDGNPRQWEHQYRKLVHDCSALHLACPTERLLANEVAQAAATAPDGVARITITRGPGARGYTLPAAAQTTRIVAVTPAPERPAHWASEGVRVRLCATRATFQPALAGIKHLNRLDSVLARAEWTDDEIAEGLLFDHRGDLVGGTMSNVFLVERGALVTPALAGAGIAGVQRDRVLALAAARGIAARIEPVPVARLRVADEFFLVNSVIGLWPVRAVDGMGDWTPGPLAVAAARWLQDEG